MYGGHEIRNPSFSRFFCGMIALHVLITQNIKVWQAALNKPRNWAAFFP